MYEKPDIVTNPDYVGINPNEQGVSIELIKKYADNVMIGIILFIKRSVYAA